MYAKHVILHACRYLGIRTLPIAVEPSGLERTVSQTILIVPLSSIAETEGLKHTQHSPGQVEHQFPAPTFAIEGG
jgi:hypothetical protein